MTDTPLPSTTPLPSSSPKQDAQPAPGRPARRRLAFGLGTAASAAIAVVLVVLVAGGAGPVPSAAAAESVQRAVAATLTSHTVSLEVTGQVAAGGQDTTLTGGGACDLRDGECSLSMSDPQLRGSIRELVTHSAVYVQLPASISQLLPKPWVEISFGKLGTDGASSEFGQNPLEGLAVLADEGAQVTRLGPATVDGRPATQYQVQLTPAVLRHELARDAAKLPTWMRSSLAAASAQEITMHAFVSSDGRLARIVVGTSLSEHGTTVASTVTETMTYDNPVVVLALPAANEVMSFQQLTSMAANGGL